MYFHLYKSLSTVNVGSQTNNGQFEILSLCSSILPKTKYSLVYLESEEFAQVYLTFESLPTNLINLVLILS
jgi:hypothetical protein